MPIPDVLPMVAVASIARCSLGILTRETKSLHQKRIASEDDWLAFKCVLFRIPENAFLSLNYSSCMFLQ